MKNCLNKFCYTLLICLLLTTLQSCEDLLDIKWPEVPYPEATQTGKNIFAFKVNGREVIENFPRSARVIGGNIFQIQDKGITIRMEIPKELNTPIDISGRCRFYDITKTDDPNQCFYERENCYWGTMTFTRFDEKEKIVSGTFAFSTNKNGCGVVQITEGIFDQKFY